MQKEFLKWGLVFILVSLVPACSTTTQSDYQGENDEPEEIENPAPTASQPGDSSDAPLLSGKVQQSMDNSDRSKLSHALDGGIGKTSTWVNNRTGIAYSVVPIQKVTINGSPYCRKYKVSAKRNNQTEEIFGTACVSANGGWEPAEG